MPRVRKGPPDRPMLAALQAMIAAAKKSKITVTRKLARAMLDAAIHELADQIASHNHVRVTGLATFTKKRFPAREWRDPHGTVLHLPPRTKLRALPDKELRARVRKGGEE